MLPALLAAALSAEPQPAAGYVPDQPDPSVLREPSWAQRIIKTPNPSPCLAPLKTSCVSATGGVGTSDGERWRMLTSHWLLTYIKNMSLYSPSPLFSPTSPSKTLVNDLIQPGATVTRSGQAPVGSCLFPSAATSAETGSSLSEPGFILV